MKKVTIHKGFHRPFTLIPACFRNVSRVRKNEKQIISKSIIFTDSCRYILDGSDQHDWNKLFGICFGWRGIHKNSARFVWRYNVATDRIDVATYYYIDGNREFEKVASLPLDTEAKFEIERDGNHVSFYIDDEFMDYNDAFKTERCMLTFGCGLYFGGNRRAPQDIIIKIIK